MSEPSKKVAQGVANSDSPGDADRGPVADAPRDEDGCIVGCEALGVLEDLPSAVLLLRDDGTPTFANRAARDLLRLPPSALAPEAREMLAPLAEALRLDPTGGERRTVSLRVAGDITIPVGYRVTPRKAPAPRGDTVVVLRDLTEIFSARRVTRAGIVRTTVQVLVSSLLHEIRNPLFAATSGIEVAQLIGDIPADLAESLDAVGEELNRIHRTLNALQRLGAPKAPARVPMPLLAAVEQTVMLYQDLLDEKRLRVTLTPSPTPGVVALDPDRFGHLLSYLFDYLGEVAPPESTIPGTVAEDEATGTVSLTLRFAYRPPPEVDLDRALRLRDAASLTYVLGLAIAKTIALEHQGNLQLEPDGAHGLIRVTLPAQRLGA